MYLSPQSSIVIIAGAGISVANALTPARKASKASLSGQVVNDCSAASPLNLMTAPDDFASNPELVHAIYNKQRTHLKKVDPNPAHRALARLDKLWPGDFLLVTENLDDLHERSGSHRIVHVNGELKKIRCLACGAITTWRRDLSVGTPCPECGRAGKLRPHVVWPGEAPLELDRIHEALSSCNLFTAIGAADLAFGFITHLSECAYTLEINQNSQPTRSCFFEHRMGPASLLVPALVDELLEGIGIQA